MQQVTVHAGSLARFLEALLVTADKGGDDTGGASGVYLRTGRAYHQGGVSQTQVLTGLTTNGVFCGRMHVMCNGELAHPVLLPRTDLGWLIPVLKDVSRDDREALITLRIDDESLSSELLVESMPHRKHEFTVTTAGSFPATACEAMLEGRASAEVVTDKTGVELPAGRMVMIPGAYHALLGSISKRMRAEVCLYQLGHPASVLVATCGVWRGAFPATHYAVDASVDHLDEQEALDQNAGRKGECDG